MCPPIFGTKSYRPKYRMLFHSDISKLWPCIPDHIDLILTSPPYPERRGDHYPTVKEADYPAWTVEWMDSAKERLRPNGSVVLVIRTHVYRGAISPYLLRTRLALYEAGWREPEELIWHKTTSPPVGHKWRPRRSWEHLLWFCLEPGKVYCDPKANGHHSERVGMEMARSKLKGLGVYEPYPKAYKMAGLAAPMSSRWGPASVTGLSTTTTPPSTPRRFATGQSSCSARKGARRRSLRRIRDHRSPPTGSPVASWAEMPSAPTWTSPTAPSSRPAGRVRSARRVDHPLPWSKHPALMPEAPAADGRRPWEASGGRHED